MDQTVNGCILSFQCETSHFRLFSLIIMLVQCSNLFRVFCSPVIMFSTGLDNVIFLNNRTECGFRDLWIVIMINLMPLSLLSLLIIIPVKYIFQADWIIFYYFSFCRQSQLTISDIARKAFLHSVCSSLNYLAFLIQ